MIFPIVCSNASSNWPWASHAQLIYFLVAYSCFCVYELALLLRQALISSWIAWDLAWLICCEALLFLRCLPHWKVVGHRLDLPYL